jgi:hypothetical protein
MDRTPDHAAAVTTPNGMRLVPGRRGPDIRVVRSGRTLTVCQAEVTAATAGQTDVSVALMQATMIVRPQVS